MLLNCFRCGVLLIAIALPLSGCNTADFSQTCGGHTSNGVDYVGYTCPSRS